MLIYCLCAVFLGVLFRISKDPEDQLASQKNSHCCLGSGCDTTWACTVCTMGSCLPKTCSPTEFTASASFTSTAHAQSIWRIHATICFTGACSNRTRGNGFKLEEGRFRWDIRKKLFTVRVVRHWNTLPSKAGDDPTLKSFKARVDGDVRNLV